MPDLFHDNPPQTPPAHAADARMERCETKENQKPETRINPNDAAIRGEVLSVFKLLAFGIFSGFWFLISGFLMNPFSRQPPLGIQRRLTPHPRRRHRLLINR